MPKLWLRLGVAGGLVAALASCAPVSDAESTDGRPVVLTTFTVLADIARNVAGDHLVVQSITKPGAEIHGYEPTPRDIAKATRADLILNNGMNLEAWFEQFLASADAPAVLVSEGITPIDIAADPTTPRRGSAGKPNPHAWMSPLNVRIYVDHMADAFANLAPEHARDFAANARDYKRQLQAVHDHLTAGIARLAPQQRALVTCEGAFSYLARDADLTEKYIWPVNAEQQATPQQVKSVIEFVQDKRVPAVFCESTVSDAPMRQVAEQTGARFGGTLYVDSLSTDDGPVPTYLDLIRHDVDVIVRALTGQAL
jgi:manganese transport system substrate-binding protein